MAITLSKYLSYRAAQPVPVSAAQLQQHLEKTSGFYYSPYYNTKDYGISISLKHYVEALLDKLFKDKVKILTFTERGWDNHQDVFSIQKVS